MAAAEARAAWQRTANRCFVQEDAKRAPKLACVPPASSSLSKQVDTRAPTLDDYVPPTANSLYSNLSPDSRWWLQLQPNYMHQMGLTHEKVNTLEAGNSQQFVDIIDSQSTVKGDNVVEESYEFVEMDSVYKDLDEFSLDSEFPHWMESGKSQDLPWWRMTDKDDLASFVAQRSHDFIENCDLPSPQNTTFKRDPFAEDQSPRKKDEGLASLGGSKPQRGQYENASSGPVSPLSDDGAVHEGSRDPTTPEVDPSKRKLLEALCHSQTRAREAEKAAKQAYEEKEHVVKLIFKQASQLFAYKQWLYLLQLENIYNQIKTNKTTPVFPASPWNVPRKKTRKNLPQPSAKRKTRAKQGIDIPSNKPDIGKYAVAFAVGLGLVGAGLLLGWTVGWMFV
nr:alanine--tRNA ligase [Tanacetum cinerariifolium]